MRFYRYTAAQKFDWHVDGPLERNPLTLPVYLNGGYEGGATTFDVDRELIDVQGEAG